MTRRQIPAVLETYSDGTRILLVYDVERVGQVVEIGGELLSRLLSVVDPEVLVSVSREPLGVPYNLPRAEPLP